MDVKIDSLLEGAKRASGHVVIIDVYRAFTSAAVALSRGAEKIIMVASVEEALRLRETGQGQLCMGEVDSVMPKGFDLGNSPYQASRADVGGKTIVQRTSAGTQGVVAAAHSDRVYTGALVTAAATVRVLTRSSPELVSLVAMGDKGAERADEDELCAIHMRSLLEGRPGNGEAVRGVIIAGKRTADFHDPAKPHLHPQDLAIALDIDRYDFAVRIRLEDGRPVARMERAE